MPFVDSCRSLVEATFAQDVLMCTRGIGVQ